MVDGQFSGIFDGLGFLLVAGLLLGLPALMFFYAGYQLVLHGGLMSQPTDKNPEDSGQAGQGRLDESAPAEESQGESKAA